MSILTELGKAFSLEKVMLTVFKGTLAFRATYDSVGA